MGESTSSSFGAPDRFLPTVGGVEIPKHLSIEGISIAECLLILCCVIHSGSKEIQIGVPKGIREWCVVFNFPAFQVKNPRVFEHLLSLNETFFIVRRDWNIWVEMLNSGQNLDQIK